MIGERKPVGDSSVDTLPYDKVFKIIPVRYFEPEISALSVPATLTAALSADKRQYLIYFDQGRRVQGYFSEQSDPFNAERFSGADSFCKKALKYHLKIPAEFFEAALEAKQVLILFLHPKVNLSLHPPP